MSDICNLCLPMHISWYVYTTILQWMSDIRNLCLPMHTSWYVYTTILQWMSDICHLDECLQSPASRVNCGFPGITQAQCESKDCCYDSSTNNSMWCFEKCKDAPPSHPICLSSRLTDGDRVSYIVQILGWMWIRFTTFLEFLFVSLCWNWTQIASSSQCQCISHWGNLKK